MTTMISISAASGRHRSRTRIPPNDTAASEVPTGDLLSTFPFRWSYLDGDGMEVHRMASEPPHVAQLEEFLAERGAPLLRTAILMTGSKEAGEDLLQAALERLYRRWRVIDRDPEGYLRQTLYSLAMDGWRRQRRWRVKLGLLHAASTSGSTDGTSPVDDRDQLVRLVVQLPPRQRAAIVLRYWEELSEAEAAKVMGCSVGTVKSAVSRGLHRLRELSGIQDTPQTTGTTGRQQ
jgi:RNA polymerase sigma-70 factor (sigma-E family)